MKSILEVPLKGGTKVFFIFGEYIRGLKNFWNQICIQFLKVDVKLIHEAFKDGEYKSEMETWDFIFIHDVGCKNILCTKMERGAYTGTYNGKRDFEIDGAS